MIEAPDNLILVRHGRAESNELHTLMLRGELDLVDEEIVNRYSENQPLTGEGQQQAESAGRWLVSRLIGEEDTVPDLFYTSPHVRTRQTAGHIGLHLERSLGSAVNWAIDRRLREQEWLGPFAKTERGKSSSPIYRKDYYSESISDTVDRFNLFMEQRRSELASKTGILVVHGHFMGAVQLALELSGQTDQKAYKEFQARSVANCNIIQYSSIDPETGTKADDLRWVRAIVPYVSEKGSDFDWTEIEVDSTFSSAELLRQTKGFKRGVPEELCGLPKP